MQHSNDTCLAYTLAAISNLLSEIGISTTTGILGSSYSPITSIGTMLSVQQQLFVLLKESFRRAESLKLKRLVAANHLAMAKFDLTVMLQLTIYIGISVCKLSLFPFNEHIIGCFLSSHSALIGNRYFLLQLSVDSGFLVLVVLAT